MSAQSLTGIPTVKYEPLYEVRIDENIEYARGLSHKSFNSKASKEFSLKLDAYIPKNDAINRPAMLLVHGGAFVGGSKQQQPIVDMAKYFASRGWAVFSIDYRLRKHLGTVPEKFKDYVMSNISKKKAQALAVYPACRDAKAAVRWMYANAETYGVNTRFITVGGGSAGAAIANMLGASNPEDYKDELSLKEDFTLQTAHLNKASKVHTVLDFWGSTKLVSVLEQISGPSRFNSSNAPILIVHGTKDPTVSFKEAEMLKQEYVNTGVLYKFCPLEGKGHGAWNSKINEKSLSDISFDFIIEEQNLIVE